MTLWPGNFSQIGYPGAGDVDDCWCVATIWAARASDPDNRKPTVTEFRRHAGDPDDGIRDGGSLDEVMLGSRGTWPGIDVTRWQGASWSAFASLVKAGRPASVALDSFALPVTHRYGFTGKHQCGLVWSGSSFLLANPLAPEGSYPKPISEAAIKKAVLALLPSSPQVRAALFTAPVAASEDDMRIDNEGPVLGIATLDVAWHLWRVDGDAKTAVQPKGKTFQVRGVVRYHKGASRPDGYIGFLVDFNSGRGQEAHVLPRDDVSHARLVGSVAA